jgi:hypothetical protein
MSRRWSIPDYVVIAVMLAGVGLAIYLAHGFYAYAF